MMDEVKGFVDEAHQMIVGAQEGMPGKDETFPYDAPLSKLRSAREANIPCTTIVIVGGDIALSFEDCGGNTGVLLDAVEGQRRENAKLREVNANLERLLEEHITISMGTRARLCTDSEEAATEFEGILLNIALQRDEAQQRHNELHVKWSEATLREGEYKRNVAALQQEVERERQRCTAAIAEVRRLSDGNVRISEEKRAIRKRAQALENATAHVVESMNTLLAQGAGQSMFYFLLLVAKHVLLGTPDPDRCRQAMAELERKALSEIHEEVMASDLLSVLGTYFPIPALSGEVEGTVLGRILIVLHIAELFAHGPGNLGGMLTTALIGKGNGHDKTRVPIPVPAP